MTKEIRLSEMELQHIWYKKRYDILNVKTTAGELVTILHTGFWNHDEGPDFEEAKIKIGDTEWVGNVEIHLQSSDWDRHQHIQNEKYNNVILHVVYVNDKEVVDYAGNPMITVQLSDYISEQVVNSYGFVSNTNNWIPCENLIADVPSIIKQQFIDAGATTKLMRRVHEIEMNLHQNQNNWEASFYQSVARSFGLRVNVDPMEELAKRVPQTIIAKQKSSLKQIEALLLGTAGLLEITEVDMYVQELKKEYQFLKQKYGLKPISASLWKMSRLRPMGFPAVRIAQFSALMYQSTHLFSKVLETEKLNELKKLWKTEPSEYWLTHYQLGKDSKRTSKKLGETTIDVILINSVIPYLFAYGKIKDEPKYVDRAIAFLQQLKPENNSIIKHWESLGVSTDSAFDSQSLLEMKKKFCDNQYCTTCVVGNFLLKA